MSEYQWIAFRAIDAPVSPANLEYMHKQSSRAEITPWSFENTYTYSDFRGNVLEMLRRGYDFHLHYADFGIRKLAIRLPWGLPNPAAAKPYVNKREITFVKDSAGPGGILEIQPFYEPDSFELDMNCEDLLEKLLPLRDELQGGDLRPLYLMSLAVACDAEHDPEEAVEGPVPAGLDELTDAQEALAEFYGLSDSLLKAAAEGCPPKSAIGKLGQSHAAWLGQQTDAAKNAWLLKLMSDDEAAVRSELLFKYRSDQPATSWPVAALGRTIATLEAVAELHSQTASRQADAKAAQVRVERLTAIAKNPEKFLRETERLVAVRSTYKYTEAAKLLVDLRDALRGTDQEGLAEQQARALKEKNPTLRLLTAALRKEGFVLK